MAALGDFRIAWLKKPMGPCVLCGDETGIGPVGWHEGNPIGAVCDECLVDAERGLGAVIKSVNIIRELALDPITDPKTFDRAASAVMTWAYLYDSTEPWPARPTAFLEQLKNRPDPDLLRIVLQPGRGNGETH